LPPGVTLIELEGFDVAEPTVILGLLNKVVQGGVTVAEGVGCLLQCGEHDSPGKVKGGEGFGPQWGVPVLGFQNLCGLQLERCTQP
jgi:hypothetical protein